MVEDDIRLVHEPILSKEASVDNSVSERSEGELFGGDPTIQSETSTARDQARAPDKQSSSDVSDTQVASPISQMPPVPLAEEHEEEDEGGLIASAIEIVNTVRDLLGAIIGSSRQTRQSWYN